MGDLIPAITSYTKNNSKGNIGLNLADQPSWLSKFIIDHNRNILKMLTSPDYPASCMLIKCHTDWCIKVGKLNVPIVTKHRIKKNGSWKKAPDAPTRLSGVTL